MGCAVCAAKIDKTIKGQPGVLTSYVKFASASLSVEYDPAITNPELFHNLIVQAEKM